MKYPHPTLGGLGIFCFFATDKDHCVLCKYTRTRCTNIHIKKKNYINTKCMYSMSTSITKNFALLLICNAQPWLNRGIAMQIQFKEKPLSSGPLNETAVCHSLSCRNGEGITANELLFCSLQIGSFNLRKNCSNYNCMPRFSHFLDYSEGHHLVVC